MTQQCPAVHFLHIRVVEVGVMVPVGCVSGEWVRPPWLLSPGTPIGCSDTVRNVRSSASQHHVSSQTELRVKIIDDGPIPQGKHLGRPTVLYPMTT